MSHSVKFRTDTGSKPVERYFKKRNVVTIKHGAEGPLAEFKVDFDVTVVDGEIRVCWWDMPGIRCLVDDNKDFAQLRFVRSTT